MKEWKLFTLTNDHGMEVQVLNYGGIITKIIVPDKDGNRLNVVLGYRNYQDYETDSNFFGAIIGRVAGRIAGASFRLNEKNFDLVANEGENHLHSGSDGFHRVIWSAEPIQSDDTVGLKLTHFSKGGEGGYPGNVKVTVTYTLTQNNQLQLHYRATTDEDTPLTLTNHSYFNLTGDLSNTIHEHHITMDSDQFVELDMNLIPTGEILDVSNTPYDFKRGRKLKDGIMADSEQNKIVGNGYDNYFIFDNNKLEKVIVKEETSGRVLTIETNQPGMVMYTANNLAEGLELTEGPSKKHLGVCFETQGSPASLHHEGFPTIFLKKGETYEKQTCFSFGVE